MWRDASKSTQFECWRNMNSHEFFFSHHETFRWWTIKRITIRWCLLLEHILHFSFPPYIKAFRFESCHHSNLNKGSEETTHLRTKERRLLRKWNMMLTLQMILICFQATIRNVNVPNVRFTCFIFFMMVCSFHSAFSFSLFRNSKHSQRPSTF